MLHVEFKKTGSLSITTALPQYIETTYSQPSDLFEDDYQQLERSREAVRQIEQAGDHAQHLLWIYYHQICRCCIQFVDLKVNVMWSHVFSKGQSMSPYLQYERLSVLFNLGALYSQLGVKQPKYGGDSLKLACRYFQWAAGIWTYLREEIETFSPPPSVDWSTATLLSLEQLMLAQAQECFLQKAISDQMKDTMVAKLASQLAYLYNASLSAAQNPSMKGGCIFEGSWSSHIASKSFYASALAYYYQAREMETREKPGESIAFLNLSEQTIKKALDHHSKQLKAELLTELKNLQTTVNTTKAKTERHNNLVFHAVVPDPASLPDIDKINMVKSLEPPELRQDINNTAIPILFELLIPATIQTKGRDYRLQQERLVQNALHQLEEATCTLTT
jgi:programmed cell death 6-interacting protein